MMRHYPNRPRLLSEADCQDILHRMMRYARGGGETEMVILSRWIGQVRWSRNRVTTSGEDQDNHIQFRRTINGASSGLAIQFNDVSDAALVAATRRAERLVADRPELFDADVASRADSRLRPRDEPVAVPSLFSEATYQLDAEQRATYANALMASATAAGMLSAGYLQVSATSMAFLTSWGYSKFFQWTWAQYSVTVRDPTGAGSGWAGVDWPEWRRIDGEKLSALALETCLKSRNPVAIEPGRYTTILEPQAVGDFVGELIHIYEGFDNSMFGRAQNESSHEGELFTKSAGDPDGTPPFVATQIKTVGRIKFGEKVMDERLSIRADPMDPDLGFPPYLNWMWWFAPSTDVYHAATWVEDGILKALPYHRNYAITELGQYTGLPSSGAFRIDVTGATQSVDEMIATTKRGLLVTRLDHVWTVNEGSTLCRGLTRDGLWLIEDGKISKPVKNMQITESILFALNNVEQVGVPQRVFHPDRGGSRWYLNVSPQPVIVPALKVRDFSFTALSDAI